MRPRILFGVVLFAAVALPTGVGIMPNTAAATAPVANLSLRPTTTPSTPTCTGNSRLMQFPAVYPVWEFCFISPNYSTGPNGSGIEIHDAYYNGHLVFKRAHAPILNVLYAPGGCGCYRDWSDQERSFSSNNILIGGVGGYAEPTTPPVTVCDNSGVETSGFSGVAAEKLADRLVLTSQTQAGWYRYMYKWTFFLDGRIKPEMGFGAVNTSSCLSYTHTHHNYWRFDFDIDDAANDRVYEQRYGVADTEMTAEAMRVTNNPGLSWSIVDSVSGRGYRMMPFVGGQTDPDTFAVGDAWLLRYNAAQIDDSGQSGPACAIKMSNFINSESLHDQDDVVWIRGGGRHLGGDLDDCHRAAMMLEPIGNWAAGAAPKK